MCNVLTLDAGGDFGSYETAVDGYGR